MSVGLLVHNLGWLKSKWTCPHDMATHGGHVCRRDTSQAAETAGLPYTFDMVRPSVAVCNVLNFLQAASGQSAAHQVGSPARYAHWLFKQWLMSCWSMFMWTTGTILNHFNWAFRTFLRRKLFWSFHPLEENWACAVSGRVKMSVNVALARSLKVLKRSCWPTLRVEIHRPKRRCTSASGPRSMIWTVGLPSPFTRTGGLAHVRRQVLLGRGILRCCVDPGGLWHTHAGVTRCKRKTNPSDGLKLDDAFNTMGPNIHKSDSLSTSTWHSLCLEFGLTSMDPNIQILTWLTA